ncbi:MULTISPECIES: glycosyltransferase family 2 protein [unclassified Pseudomonas]|uniref:glycosyltransferase family 2 protein n=1 Tax=unclassified Pseudomonas TaxID=196821 RepID=UPI00249B7FFA|nr:MULTISPECIES: glycosyltransferase family 2 protein [unclassified Pseudomonas]
MTVSDHRFGTDHAVQAAGEPIANVAILMCTYNGASFLAEQLKSFQRQTYPNWTLYVSDDGSQDGTQKILQTFRSTMGVKHVHISEGPKRGFVANFLSLACRSDITAKFFAWSDQDDIWKDEKLEKAVTWLQNVPADIPALYCGRTELIGESGDFCGYSPRFRLPPHFSNALVQSIGGGNTMVFNQAARKLLLEAGDRVDVPCHDWWAYVLISGAGGEVHYDPEPMLLYRQHDENLIGGNSGWLARLERLPLIFRGSFCKWNDQIIHALEAMYHRLSPEHQVTFGRFKEARKQKLFPRILGFQRAGIYRQTFFGNLGLILVVLLKKI